MYSSHPDQPFNRDMKKSRDPHLSGFPKPKAFPGGEDLWAKVNGELDLGLVDKPVNAIALHQAVSSMSLELRVCQESLAKARMDRKADRYYCG
jgi:hypothetical protein